MSQANRKQKKTLFDALPALDASLRDMCVPTLTGEVLSWRKIAKKLGVSTGAVTRRVQQLNLTKPPTTSIQLNHIYKSRMSKTHGN